MRRWGVVAIWLGAVAAAATLGWWGARQTLTSPDNPVEATMPTTYRVVEGEIGRSISLVVLAEWPAEPAAFNRAAGIVTDAFAGATVVAGDVIYEVDGRPVVAGQGATPAYRDLARNDEGADVRQLQQFLVDLGHATFQPDGKFGGGTLAAVRAWQRTLGLSGAGAVAAGDLVWLPELPARLRLDDTLRVGLDVAGGEQILQLADAPRFSIPVGGDQFNAIPDSAAVAVRHPGGVWEGRVAEAVPRAASEVEGFDLILTDAQGAPICGNLCADVVPLGAPVEFRAEVVLVPATTGPVVPASAVVTRPDGSAYVTAADGSQIPVTVVGSDGSILLVEGVAAGTEVRVFGDGP